MCSILARLRPGSYQSFASRYLLRIDVPDKSKDFEVGSLFFCFVIVVMYLQQHSKSPEMGCKSEGCSGCWMKTTPALRCPVCVPNGLRCSCILVALNIEMRPITTETSLRYADGNDYAFRVDLRFLQKKKQQQNNTTKIYIYYSASKYHIHVTINRSQMKMSFLLVSIFKMQVFLILDVLGGGILHSPHSY